MLSRSRSSLFSSVSISLCLIASPLAPAIAGAACPNMKDSGTPFTMLRIELTLAETYEQEIEYEQNKGPAETGLISVDLTGPIEDAGSTCLENSYKNGEKCLMKLKCKEDEKAGGGEAKGEQPGITWWSALITCLT